MRNARGLWTGLALALVAAGVPALAAAADGPALAHMVFFDVKGEGDAAALVEACRKHLSGHDGTLYFSVGRRAPENARDVNDLGFDVALHIVFDSKAAHDAYQKHPRHLEFIAENEDRWARVRVFDSYVD